AGDDKDIVVGMPNVDKAKVEIEVLEHAKGEKVNTKIFKAKSRYRRSRGFRKQVTKFKVLSIKY
ncbi:bL21 family ribosomal protein, partial [Candidatus Dojkabacteria bacterium]|nr:bL21 family ribosomal protein [Candidatus Dojkabacteria bacterium]